MFVDQQYVPVTILKALHSLSHCTRGPSSLEMFSDLVKVAKIVLGLESRQSDLGVLIPASHSAPPES